MTAPERPLAEVVADDRFSRELAARRLREANHHALAAELAPFLTAEDAQLRAGAVHLLVETLAHAALPALEGALGDPERKVREAAVAALPRCGARGRAALARACRDADDRVRSAAAMALARHPRPEERAVLRDLLEDEDTVVRLSAAGALAALGDPNDLEPLLAAMKRRQDAGLLRAARKLAPGDPRALQAARRLLAHPDGGARRTAAEALGDHGAAEDVAPLASALARDPEPYVRWTAAVALGELGARLPARAHAELEGAGAALQAALDDANGHVRSYAAGALAKLPDGAGQGHAQAIVAALERHGQRQLAASLAQLPPGACAVGPLRAALQAAIRERDELLAQLQDSDYLARIGDPVDSVLPAFAALRDPEAAPALLAMLREGTGLEVSAAQEGLRALGPGATPELTRAFAEEPPGGPLSDRLAEALCGLGDPAALAAVRAARGDAEALRQLGRVAPFGRPRPSEAAGREAIAALGWEGAGALALAQLEAWLAAPADQGADAALPHFAARVLGAVGDRRATALLAACLARPKLDLDAVWALLAIADPASAPALVEHVLAREGWQALQALRALGAAAVPALAAGAHDAAAPAEGRASLAQLLAELAPKDPAARVALRELAQDPLDSLRSIALEALAGEGPADPSALVAALASRETAPAAARGLAALGQLGRDLLDAALVAADDLVLRAAIADALAR
ncbi:MAG: HEAT repeat domain-containing protein [Planctomycetota bacterium]